jgi:hypothetical protein
MLQQNVWKPSQPVSLWTCQKDALAFQFHQDFPSLSPTQQRFSVTFKSTSLLLLLLSPSSPIAVASVACGLLFLLIPRWNQSQAFARGWYKNRLDANPTALDVYQQHEASIRIVDGLYDLFLPTSSNNDPVVALVLLPGSLIDARAYAGVCHKVRQEGNIAVILLQTERYRRLMSPFFGIDEHALRDVLQHATNELAKSNHSVRNWALGGHSFGGLTAQELLPKMSEISKLVLWGVYYPPRDTPISPTVPELMVTASQDGFRFGDPPPSTPAIELYEVPGGNHGGFGDYPHQTYPRPDGTRTISLTEQHEQVARVTAQFLLS